MNYDELQKLSPPAFKRICGVSHQTFKTMLDILNPHLERKGKRGGQNKLSVENQLIISLQYWREYRTQLHIAVDFGISEATVCRIIQKVENLLVCSGQFRLAGKNHLQKLETEVVAIVDVSEVEIERPKKRQRHYYSGKKKKHTLKAQVLVNLASGEFMAVGMGKGRSHDFSLFKKTKWRRMAPSILCLADKGYQGIHQIHANSMIPQKKKPKQVLEKAEKQSNRELAQARVKVEHGIRRLKRFRIFSGRYRNRRRRFGLRLHLLAGIINFELNLVS